MWVWVGIIWVFVNTRCIPSPFRSGIQTGISFDFDRCCVSKAGGEKSDARGQFGIDSCDILQRGRRDVSAVANSK